MKGKAIVLIVYEKEDEGQVSYIYKLVRNKFRLEMKRKLLAMMGNILEQSYNGMERVNAVILEDCLIH